MKSANSPESKNRKRKVALTNLEKNLSMYRSGETFFGKATKETPKLQEHCDVQITRIQSEITKLKARILN